MPRSWKFFSICSRFSAETMSPLHPLPAQQPGAPEPAHSIEQSVAEHHAGDDHGQHDVPAKLGILVADHDARGDDGQFFRKREAESGCQQRQEDAEVAVLIELIEHP